MENGEKVNGEDDIDVPRPGRDVTIPIKKIWLEPEATAYEKVVSALGEADYIVIGPGDLYSSLLPCFIPKGMMEAVANSKAKIIYICNLLAKPGESYKFAANDHVKKILEYTGRQKLDYLIVADEKMGEKFIAGNPEVKDYSPVRVDSAELAKTVENIISADPMSAEELGKVLAQMINNA